MLGGIDDKALEKIHEENDRCARQSEGGDRHAATENKHLRQAANACRNVGSPYHKSYPGFAGVPRSRPRTAKFPKDLKDWHDLKECALRDVLTLGQVYVLREGGFPRCV